MTWALLLAACYFILMAPLAGQPSLWRGDERFYTDAALQMLQSGDWLTTRYGDGSLRFRKPGMAYWAVAASQRTFGVRLTTARLPSLAAGALTVGLTFLLGLRLFGSLRAALAGAVLFASCSLTHKLSLRATPDMLLTFFVTLCVIGAVRVRFAGRRDETGLLLGYGGAALAIATKGLTGLLALGCAGAAAAGDRRGGVRPRDLVSWPAILLALPLAGLWYLLIVLRYGGGALLEFFRDQVGDRLDGNPFGMLGLFFAYLFSLPFNTLPWSVAALAAARLTPGYARTFLAARSRELRLAAIWVAGFVVCFSIGNLYRERYLLPLYPLLCVLLGGYLAGWCDTRTGTWPRLERWLRAAFVAGGASVSALALGGLWHGGWLAAGYGLLGLLAAAGAVRRPGFMRMPLTALLLVALQAQTDLVVRPALRPSPVPELAARLTALKARDGDVAAPAEMDHEAGLLRVWMGGTLNPVMLPEGAGPDEWRAHRVLVAPEAWGDRLEEAGYRLTEAGHMRRSASTTTWLRALRTLNPRLVFRDRQRCYYVAVRRDAAGEGDARGVESGAAR